MSQDVLLDEMRRTQKAVKTVYDELPPERQKWMELRYWNKPKLKASEVALRVGITYRQSARWRKLMLVRLAELMGRW
jgi:hypothetical protein